MYIVADNNTSEIALRSTPTVLLLLLLLGNLLLVDGPRHRRGQHPFSGRSRLESRGLVIHKGACDPRLVFGAPAVFLEGPRKLQDYRTSRATTPIICSWSVELALLLNLSDDSVRAV